MTYKDELENRKNARKHAQHQNQQEQPAKLASRKKALLARLEKNIRDLGVTIETDDQTGAIGLKRDASSEIVRINVGPDRYMLHTSKERGGRALVPCIKACISSGVSWPSLLASIPLKIRS